MGHGVQAPYQRTRARARGGLLRRCDVTRGGHAVIALAPPTGVHDLRAASCGKWRTVSSCLGSYGQEVLNA